MTDSELRGDEFLCLESLLSLEEFQKTSDTTGIIEIHPVMSHSTEVVVIESKDKMEDLKNYMLLAEEPDDIKNKFMEASFKSKHVAVSHLPPIRCKFSLPDGYPSHDPPEVSFSACWMPRRVLHQLEQHVRELWSQNGQQAVLYEIFQFISDRASSGRFFPFSISCLPLFCRDSFAHFDQATAKLESSNVLVVETPMSLLNSLQRHNDNRVVVLFQQQTHPCPVCFGSFPGTSFTRLTNCRHFICKECMQALCEGLIKDSSLDRLVCMECSCELNPFDIQLSVQPASWEKYQQFQLDTALSSMHDIVYCPRPKCNQAVLKEGESAAGRCPGCYYVFCIHCKKGYHGVEPCAYDGDKRILVEEYEHGDAKTRKELEKRYGRGRLRNLGDEIKAEDWVSKNAKQCPKCRFPVEKLGGCNKMVCTKCGSAFCWLCMLKLPADNPYGHFQDPKNKSCYMNLMLGIQVDDNDDEGNEDDQDLEDDDAFANWFNLDMPADGAVMLEEMLRHVLRQAVELI